MIVKYIACDGKEFDSRFECEEHEWQIEHAGKYDGVKTFDKSGKELTNIFNPITWLNVSIVIVPNGFDFQLFIELAERYGYPYNEITSSGIWVYCDARSEKGFVKIWDGSASEKRGVHHE